MILEGIPNKMPDLTFNALKAKLPANAVTAANGDVLISVKAVMGESSVVIDDQKVGECIAKILDAASLAQNDHNAVNTPKFRSYNAPSTGAPFRNPTTGIYYSTFTYSLSVQIPLNRDTVDAVESTVSDF